MSSERNKRRIRNILINNSVQYRVILVNLLFMLLVVFVTMTIIYTHISERELGAEDGLKYLLGDLTITFSVKLILLYLLLFLIFLISITVQLKMTHRVCGPLVNFCNTFKKISDGDFLGRVNLRKEDLLKKEAASFNEMITKICELVNELKLENERLNSAISDVEKEGQL